MAGLNRRGPNGEVPMTGRKMGRCNPDSNGIADNESLQIQNEINQRQGILRGRGFGRRNGSGFAGRLGLGKGQANRFRGNG